VQVIEDDKKALSLPRSDASRFGIVATRLLGSAVPRSPGSFRKTWNMELPGHRVANVLEQANTDDDIECVVGER
jgi:hypothetical protein